MAKKLPEQLFSKIKGAVFISRNTGDVLPDIRSGIRGITKYHGCVEFSAANYEVGSTTFSTKAKCIAKYYDFPTASSAWLVTPQGKDYLWVDVTDKLAFSN